MHTKKQVTPSQWVQLGGEIIYEQGMVPYQEGDDPQEEEEAGEKMQEGGVGFDQVAWEMIRGLGKAGVSAARMGAGQATQFGTGESLTVPVTNGR